MDLLMYGAFPAAFDCLDAYPGACAAGSPDYSACISYVLRDAGLQGQPGEIKSGVNQCRQLVRQIADACCVLIEYGLIPDSSYCLGPG